MGIVRAMAYIESAASIIERGATMPGTLLRLLCIAGLLSAATGARLASAATPDAYDPWPGLVQDIFNNRPMNDGGDVIGIEMPYRAEDAAIVPVTLRTKLAPTDERRVLSITLVIDQNPAPMAAKFELGKDARISEISTRVRVNPDEARNRIGQMRYRQFGRPEQGPTSGGREAQIMIGHPNNSGLQMDQVTQLYIPAFFINELHLWQDDSPVLSMEGGISISEDPNIRFTYVSSGAKRFRAEAKDTQGHVFQHEWNVDDSGI